MVGTVYDLVCANAVGVVLEFREGMAAVAVHFLELTVAASLRLPAEQNALRTSDMLKLVTESVLEIISSRTEPRCFHE